MKNLHPNNVFINPDMPSDVLITDVGFADFPGIKPRMDCHFKFIAPELTAMMIQNAIYEGETP